MEAGGRQEAFRLMEGRGLRPISLAERRNGNGQMKTGAARGPVNGSAQPFRLALGGSKKISARTLENFTRLLSSLLAAGVPLSRALVILQKEASTPVARAKWKEIHDLVVDGMSLAGAMGKSPETFPRVYVAMVEAGESGGFLDVVLNQIVDFQSREKEMRSKMMAALLYPSILLCLALGVLSFLLIFFIPRFQSIFAGFGGQLPLLTQLIVGAELVAKAIHYNSPRLKGPFVAVSLTYIPKDLIEAELFACEKGAFTGDTEKRIGKIEEANEGTLFIDEISETDIKLQANFYVLYGKREFCPLNSNNSLGRCQDNWCDRKEFKRECV